MDTSSRGTQSALPVTVPAQDLPFEIKHVDKGVFRIRERHFVTGTPANIWFVQGSRIDMIVDAGTGIWDLKGFLKSLGIVGAKPLLVVATHKHFDHAGGLHQFEDTAAHANDAESLAQGDNVAAGTCLTSPEISHPPGDNWSVTGYRVPATPIHRVLHDQDVLVLGDRHFEVLHLPGHTSGSIALFERKTGFLFGGDTVVEGPLIDWLPSSSVADYIMSCQRLSSLAPFVKTVFPGRLEHFSGKRLAELANAYASKAEGCTHRMMQVVASGLASLVLRVRNNPVRQSCGYCCCGCC
eukprot:m.45559 g.45559  ORF g.45559 m.45559 type:complete len:296 (-) comp11792_c0_seq1:41-928(-)